MRDDEWLKVMSLYWPSVRRLVPRTYPKRDSHTARVLADASILIDEDPRQQLSQSSEALFRALNEHAERLTRSYSIDRAIAEWDGRKWAEQKAHAGGRPELAWLHIDKVPTRMLERLVALGLATAGRSYHDHVGEWVGVHPALAGAYMTTIAVDISRRSGFHPLTDQSDLSVATPAQDVGAAINLLVGHDPNVATTDTPSGTEDYVMLAMQYAIPKGLTALSVDEVIQCRQKLREELIAFRDYVESQRTALSELVSIEGERRRLEAFTDHVNRTIEVPLRKLERGLRLHKLEPARALMLTGTVVPPAAVGTILNQVGAGPLVTSATATLTAVGNAWWQVRNVRSAARSASAVGYLLDVRDRLTPTTLSNKIRQLFLGTAGRQS